MYLCKNFRYTLILLFRFTYVLEGSKFSRADFYPRNPKTAQNCVAIFNGFRGPDKSNINFNVKCNTKI